MNPAGNLNHKQAPRMKTNLPKLTDQTSERTPPHSPSTLPSPHRIVRGSHAATRVCRSGQKLLAIGLWAMLCALRSSADPYTVDYLTVGSGVSTSTNGNYVISFTIGQAVAPAGSGSGQYDFAGGFWTLFG